MKTLPSLILGTVIVLFGFGLMLLFSQPWLVFGALKSFTKSVKVTAPGQDRGYYYRFRASLAYKGEPLEFDIVVGCNVRITTYKDNDRTVEVGVAPMAFGLKMKDRHGVVIRPPQACKGETTENGRVPQDLLPLVVTYDDAEAPWSGIAYASEDAYESPLSELKFFGASISKTTFEEWQEWRRTEAPKNFITYDLLGINPRNMWDFPHWKPGYRVMASGCLGASWIKLPDAARDLARRFWPASKPAYWFPSWEMRRALWSIAVDPKDPVLFEGNRFSDYLQDLDSASGAQGLPRRRPGAMILFNRYAAGDVYPARIDRSVNRMKADGELPSAIKGKPEPPRIGAETRPELRGFAYCDDTVFKVEDVPGGFYGTPVFLSEINGKSINEELQSWREGSQLDFERDEFAVLPRRYQIGNNFGGL